MGDCEHGKLAVKTSKIFLKKQIKHTKTFLPFWQKKPSYQSSDSESQLIVKAHWFNGPELTKIPQTSSKILTRDRPSLGGRVQILRKPPNKSCTSSFISRL